MARDMSPRGRFFMALGFFAFGLFLFGFVFGWIPTRPSSSPTPLYVNVAAAMMFTLGGVIILLIESERWAWLRNLVMWLFVVSLAIPFNWVAFVAGERHFSGSSSFLGFTMSSAPGEMEGRVFFGLLAVLLDLLVIFAPLSLLRKKKSA